MAVVELAAPIPAEYSIPRAPSDRPLSSIRQFPKEALLSTSEEASTSSGQKACLFPFRTAMSPPRDTTRRPDCCSGNHEAWAMLRILSRLLCRGWFSAASYRICRCVGETKPAPNSHTRATAFPCGSRMDVYRLPNGSH